MVKRKSYVTMFLIVCMLISAMFMLVACGENNNDAKTTVTAEQWQSALNFEGVTDFYMQSNGILNVREYKANATSASDVLTNAETNAVKSKAIYKTEVEEGQNVVYKYTYNTSANTWSKVKITTPETMASLVNPKANFSKIVNAFDSFEYNKKAKAYCSKSPVIYSGASVNLTLKFKNGKLDKVEYTFTEGAFKDRAESAVITYGNTTTEQLPENIADLLV